MTKSSSVFAPKPSIPGLFLKDKDGLVYTVCACVNCPKNIVGQDILVSILFISNEVIVQILAISNSLFSALCLLLFCVYSGGCFLSVFPDAAV